MADEQQQERPEADTSGESAVEAPKAIFRIPKTAYLAIAFLVFCMTPVALGEFRWLVFIYVFPLILLVFVVRTRTVADSGGLTVRTVFGERELPWAALKGLELTDKARVRAVLTDDTKVTLPTVRTRHLPVISLVSGGRMKDPSGVTDDVTEESGASAQE